MTNISNTIEWEEALSGAYIAKNFNLTIVPLKNGKWFNSYGVFGILEDAKKDSQIRMDQKVACHMSPEALETLVKAGFPVTVTSSWQVSTWTTETPPKEEP